MSLDSGPPETPPVVPGCEPAVCGDGVVGIGEECDSPGDDTCSPDCVRPGFHDLHRTDAVIAGAAFDGDGSAVVVIGYPFSVSRLSPDGETVWRATPDGPNAAIPKVFEVTLGDPVEVVGITVDTPGWVGTRWRVGNDGTSSAGILDPQDRNWLDATKIGTTDVLVLIGDDEHGASIVERHDGSGAVLWSRDGDPQQIMSLWSIADADDVIVAVGHVAGTGQAAIVRIEGEDSTTIPLPAEFASARLHGVVGDGSGGAFFVGHTDTPKQDPIAGRLSSSGAFEWISSCFAPGVFANVTMIEDRVVLYGRRAKPENCEDECGGEDWPWVQQLDPNGTVLATDAPFGLLAIPPDASHERIVAVGRTPNGLRVAGGADDNGSTANDGFLLTVPW